MKIDLNSAVANQVSVERSAKQPSASSTSVAGSASQDRTTFSSTSTSVQSLVGQALSNPAVRQDRVSTLQQSISSGEYKLDPNKIASAIISEGGQ